MFNLFLILFVSSELCYYLLIAQTGIVEVFNSNLQLIALLPIGGVIGSFLSSHIKIKEEIKVYILLILQFIVSFYYPDITGFLLFVLGIAVGGMAPLIISTLKKATYIDLIISLSLAYVIGTWQFPNDPLNRDLIAVSLTVVTIVSYIIFSKKATMEKNIYFKSYPLLIMVFWVFLDSALFETLSRDILIPIWRGDYTFEIMFFHIIGLIAAISIKIEYYQKSLFILILFALSYLFYFLREPLFLSIVYPFVISYYNIVILQSLIQEKSLKTIGIYMIFIGWIASGAGLLVALEQYIIYVPTLFLIAITYIFSQQTYLNKESYHV